MTNENPTTIEAVLKSLPSEVNFARNNAWFLSTQIVKRETPDDLDDKKRTPKVGPFLRENSHDNRYLVEENPTDFGHFGELFRAWDTKRGCLVMVKMLKENILSRNTNANFEREALVTGNITHPNILPIYEYMRHFSTPKGPRDCYVMKYVEGTNLDKRIEEAGNNKRGLPLKEISHVLGQLVDVVHYLSEVHNIIHRDLKPDNILLDKDDHLYLTDLGISSKVYIPDLEDDVIGAFRYLSPESAEGWKFIDERSEVYSIGVILYEMLSGGRWLYTEQVPKTDIGKLKHLIYSDPIPLSTIVEVAKQYGTETTKDLDALILKAVNKNPDQRQSTVIELLHDFMQIVSQTNSQTRPQ